MVVATTATVVTAMAMATAMTGVVGATAGIAADTRAVNAVVRAGGLWGPPHAWGAA